MNFESLNITHTQSRALSEAKGRMNNDVDASRDELFAPAAAFAAALGAKLDDRLDETYELDEAATREQREAEQLREAAEQLVASAFVLPFLQQVRSESLRSDLMHGGFAEDAFGQQLDTHLADKFVQSGNFPLVDAVEQYMTKRGGPSPDALGQQLNLQG
ncbi:hypothetical protein ACERK3_11975 [Phycisphaerales bacterium AB-hyl4]|uniref:Uncharacterized protein n=1 Tax=Natronomicrosphaera hydrolytica TaxID=3242702 RepID=A0ABV4U9Q5_9BACT